MRTNKILIAVVMLIFAFNLNAKVNSDKANETYLVSSTSIKENILLNKNDKSPCRKIVYEYDNLNRLISKMVYNWSKDMEWVPLQKYHYNYNVSTKPYSIQYFRWNAQGNAWTPIVNIN